MFVIDSDIQLVALPSLNQSLFGLSEFHFLMFPARMDTERCSECQVDADATLSPSQVYRLMASKPSPESLVPVVDEGRVHQLRASCH